jgi:hypothetical protein
LEGTVSTAIATLETQARSSSSYGEQLGAEITKLCSYIYAAEARLLNLIRIFDERKYWEELGLCSCAHWLNFKCGIGMNAAREKVRVAHALADLPKISMAIEKGELSYSKVRAMTRIADSSNEDYLLMIAHHGTAHHVEKLVSKFRSVKKLNAQDDVGEASSRDIVGAPSWRDGKLTHYYDHDGCLVIKARLPAEQGALIVKALEMAMDREFADSEPVGMHPVGAGLARDISGNTVGPHPVGARLARDTDAIDTTDTTDVTAVTSVPIARRPPRRRPRRNRRDLHEQQRIIGLYRGSLPGRSARTCRSAPCARQFPRCWRSAPSARHFPQYLGRGFQPRN